MPRCRVIRHRGLRLQLAVLYHRKFKPFFQDKIALRKPLLQISHGKLCHAGNVISDKTGMNGRRIWFHGLQGIKDSRQLLVFHPNQLKSLLCRLLRIRGDCCHLIAHITQFLIKDLLILHRNRRRVRLAAGAVKMAFRCIFIGSYGTYSWQFFRLRRIDRHDSGMWIRASQYFCMQHPGKL